MQRLGSRTRESATGFTLVELMIVVVILGVLSAVAVLAYSTYVRRARIAEAAGLLANIKASQESYRSEFGLYCNVAAPEPSLAPQSDGRLWDADAVDERWSQLGFSPDTRIVSFQLDTISNTPGQNTTTPFTTAPNDVTLPVAAAEFTQDHWFIARALGNQDDDSDLSVFWITHMTTGVSYKREVE